MREFELKELLDQFHILKPKLKRLGISTHRGFQKYTWREDPIKFLKEMVGIAIRHIYIPDIWLANLVGEVKPPFEKHYKRALKNYLEYIIYIVTILEDKSLDINQLKELALSALVYFDKGSSAHDKAWNALGEENKAYLLKHQNKLNI